MSKKGQKRGPTGARAPQRPSRAPPPPLRWLRAPLLRAGYLADNAFAYEKCKVVAEIGCNHMGDLNLAKELMLLAKGTGATYAKFQKRCAKELLTEEQYNKPHPVPSNAFGGTYGAHREFLEFDVKQHRELWQYGKEIGIEWATSVWDVTSAREMIQIPCDFLKVRVRQERARRAHCGASARDGRARLPPRGARLTAFARPRHSPSASQVPSACNNHFEMLKVLRDEFSGKVHVSTGMTTKKEIEDVVAFFEETGQAKSRLVVYNCTSGYPVPFKDVCMLELVRLYQEYGGRVHELAFSGHHLGISIDIAAYTLGAKWIERHFTKDRTMKGTDHAASLEPAGLGKLVRDLEATYQSLTYKGSEILELETEQRDKLKFRKTEKVNGPTE